MAFVRSKTVNGKRYFQVVRNYREGGKHRQEVLYHLGLHRSIDEAIWHHREGLRSAMEAGTLWEKEAKDVKEYMLEFYGIRIFDETEAVDETERPDSLEHEHVLNLWEEWGEETRRLYRTRLEEFGPVEGRVEHLRAKRVAEGYLKQAEFHYRKLQELRRVKAEYFPHTFQY